MLDVLTRIQEAPPGVSWIDFGAYAHRVFASAPERFLLEPALLAGTLAQANRVIGSDIVTIDLHRMLAESMAAGSHTVLDALADCPAPLSEVIHAVAHALPAVGLALRVDDPVLVAGAGADPDEVDDVADAVTAVLRSVSADPIDVLVLRAQDSADPSAARMPLIAAAGHYGWTFALQVPQSGGGSVTADAIRVGGPVGHAPVFVGSGLDERFWLGEAPVPAGPLRFGAIPPDASPERVVERARELRIAVSENAR